MRGSKSERRNFRSDGEFFKRTFSQRASAAYFFAVFCWKSSGTRDMFSAPPTIKTEPRPAAIRSKAVVTASNPEAQLRWTVSPGPIRGCPRAGR